MKPIFFTNVDAALTHILLGLFEINAYGFSFQVHPPPSVQYLPVFSCSSRVTLS